MADKTWNTRNILNTVSQEQFFAMTEAFRAVAQEIANAPCKVSVTLKAYSTDISLDRPNQKQGLNVYDSNQALCLFTHPLFETDAPKSVPPVLWTRADVVEVQVVNTAAKQTIAKMAIDRKNAPYRISYSTDEAAASKIRMATYIQHYTPF